MKNLVLILMTIMISNNLLFSQDSAGIAFNIQKKYGVNKLSEREKQSLLTENNWEIVTGVCEVVGGCAMVLTGVGSAAGVVLLVKGAANLVNTGINRNLINDNISPNASSALGSIVLKTGEVLELDLDTTAKMASIADVTDVGVTVLIGGYATLSGAHKLVAATEELSHSAAALRIVPYTLGTGLFLGGEASFGAMKAVDHVFNDYGRYEIKQDATNVNVIKKPIVSQK